MSEPLTTSDRAGDAKRAAEGGSGSPWRRAAPWVLVAIVSYGLTLSLVSDTVFWLAIPGLIGLTSVGVVTLHKFLHRSFGSDVPYATDGTDRRGVVRYHYVTLLKRYATLLVVAAACVSAPLAADVFYVYPFMGIGILIVKAGTYVMADQLLVVRKCSRVLKVYDFEFRAPVRTVIRQSRGRRQLRMGERPRRSPKMLGRTPLDYHAWPPNIADGVWFAGDDAFGGVLLVPGSGDMMCMRPLEWEACQQDRASADAERRAKAERAGLDRRCV